MFLVFNPFQVKRVLSPIEIKKHEFGKAFRGCDLEEVRGFLDSIAGDLERLMEQNRSQASELERLRAENSAFQRVEHNLKDALLQAQDNLQKVQEASRKEADLVVREAQLQAENILREARKQAADIEREIEALGAKRDRFVRKLRILLSSELEILQMLEGFETEDNRSRRQPGEVSSHPSATDAACIKSAPAGVD